MNPAFLLNCTRYYNGPVPVTNHIAVINCITVTSFNNPCLNKTGFFIALHVWLHVISEHSTFTCKSLFLQADKFTAG